MKLTLLKSAAIASALALTAPVVAQEQEVTADTVVARIGDTEITMGHVLTVRQQLPQEYSQMPADVLFKGIVDQLVDQYLLAQRVDGTEDLPRSLQLRLENDRRAILATAAIQEIAAGEIDPAAVQEAYDAAYGDVEPESQFNASHILVETEEEAEQIIADLATGADFATLAQERSTGPSGPDGGELGWFGMGQMVPEFEQAVVALEPGDVSEPVQTQFGWHVVKLNETRDVPPPSLDAVRAEIENQIRQERVAAAVAELRAEAAPEILLDQIDPAALGDDSLLAE